jgi:hypothetical protein
MFSADRGPLGCPEAAAPSLFREGRCDRSPRTVPLRSHEGLSSLRLHAFFRVPHSEPATEAFRSEDRSTLDGAFLGVRPALITASVGGVHSAPATPTSSGYVPSSAFHPPSTVFSTTGLAGLFHPAAMSRVRPPGGFPPAEPYRVSPAAALLPLRTFALPV